MTTPATHQYWVKWGILALSLTLFAASVARAHPHNNRDGGSSLLQHRHKSPLSANKAGNNDSDCITNPWPLYYSNVLKMREKLLANTAMVTSTSFAFLNPTTGVFAVYAILPKDREVWAAALAAGSANVVEQMKSAAISKNQLVYNFGCALNTSSHNAGVTAAFVTLTPKVGIQAVDSNGLVYCSPVTVYPADVGVPETSQLVLEDNCGITIYEHAPLTNAIWGSNTWVCAEVHIVPHSHDDVGWLLTPERYYDGCYDPNGGVQSIIRTMVEALYDNPARRFIQVEQYFFHRWWIRQDEATKAKTRTVVERGQLLFINGGWSMHDEAGVHQESAISNWARGVQFVTEEFGLAGGNVTVGWHIDPFGHASATPRLMAQLGFNSFFFWRTDYQQANFMKATKTLETVWSSSPSLGDEVLMFTSIMPDGYCEGCGGGFDVCPSPFCCFSCMDDNGPPWWAQLFNVQRRSSQKKSSLNDMRKMFRMKPQSAGEDGSNSRRNIHDVGSFADEYIKTLLQYGAMYRTNKVLIPWGCDFQHIDAHTSFALMDSIFAHVAQNYPYLTFQYSTPDAYQGRVLDSGFKWPMNFDDYFLDSDNEHAYWSGYLTSHAEYKHFERNLMNRRSSTDILLSSQPSDPETFSSRWNSVDSLRQALGVAQHHDSITGTARASVWNQYRSILTAGMRDANSVLSLLLEDVTGLEFPRTCDLNNVSVCTYTNPLSPNGTVTVVAYNSLQQDRHDILAIPIPTHTIRIVAAATYDSATGAKQFQNIDDIVYQVQTTWELTTTPDPTSTPYPQAPQPYEALVRVKIPSRGIFAFTLEGVPESDGSAATHSERTVAKETPLPLGSPVESFGNAHVTVTVDPSAGLVGLRTISPNGATHSETALRQGFFWYCPNAGDNGTQASGAYIFRPCTPDGAPIPFASGVHQMTMVKGPLCTEARMIIDYDSSIQQTIRVCQDGVGSAAVEGAIFNPYTWENYVTLIIGLGSIDPGTLGKEVIMKIAVDNNTIRSASTWYVDSQALEMQKRVRDSRPNYPYNATEPVAANFFPSNQWAMINDSQLAMSVVSDYSRATASLHDGELEFLMIRRLLHDDGRGVAQALNNSERVVSRNRLYFGPTANVVEYSRFASITHTHPSLQSYSQQSVNINITSPQRKALQAQQLQSVNGLPPTASQSFPLLPSSVHLHTMEMITPTTLILRLQHIFAKGESEEFSVPVQVDLSSLIPAALGSIASVEQMDLSGTKTLSQLNAQRLRRTYQVCNAATKSVSIGPAMFSPAASMPSDPTKVTLNPMDIITFRVTLSP